MDNSHSPPDSNEQVLGNVDSSTNEKSSGSAEAGTPPVAAEGLASATATEMENQLADNDVLAAVTSMTADTLANLEHTLDQLTTATDLFDVPVVDFDSAADS